MNKNLFEAEMKLNGDNGGTLAEYLGITRQTLSNKKNEYKGAEFTQGEIMAMSQRYQWNPEKIALIFFSSKVS